MAIKKLSSGAYQIDYRDKQGVRTRASYPTMREAKVALANVTGKLSTNEYVSPRSIPTFRAQAEKWLESKSTGDTARRPGTRANWRAHLDLHLFPRIGDLRLDYLTIAGVEKLRAELLASGLGVTSANAVVTTLGAVLKMAMRHGVLRSNPVDLIERSFVGSKELKSEDDEDSSAIDPASVLNPTEIAAMLDKADEGYYRTLFTTAYLTGMRNGELFALRWSDVELASIDPATGKRTGKGKIRICRSLTWAKTEKEKKMRAQFYPPKTKAGTRTIPIPHTLVSALKVWKVQCPVNELDLVFPDSDGKPMHRANALKRGLRPALRRAELRQVTMHSLRHSFASALIAKGAPVTEVQHLLGHSNPAITMRVYSRWFHDTESDSTDRLADALNADIKKTNRRKNGHFLDTSSRTPKASKIGESAKSLNFN